MKHIIRVVLVLALVGALARADEPKGDAASGGALRAVVDRLRGGKQDQLDFWMAIEELHAPALSDDERAKALTEGLGEQAAIDRVLARRKEAREVARGFCHDWNESYTIGSGEKERYDKMKDGLAAAGVACAPYLLEVLAVHPTIAFGDMDDVHGVTARMQVRAIFGVTFLKIADAVPYLVLHARGMSLTAASNAGAALQGQTGQDFGYKGLGEGDRAKVEAWWSAHRGEYATAIGYLVPRLIDQLRTERSLVLLGQTMKVSAEMREDVLKALELVTGETFTFDPRADEEARASQVDKIEKGWQAHHAASGGK